ncbi:response regulator [[Eubacterium] cellulosolvens]
MAEEKVLVVDDEAGIRKMFRRHLEKAGYKVEEADGCEKAIELLKQHEFDVILLDIIMPKRDGVMCLSEIKSEFQNTPVIMVTGIDNIQTGVEVMKKGAFDYIVKPVKRNELLSAVENGVKEKERIKQEDYLEPFKVHYILLLNSAGIVLFHKNYDPDIKMDGDLFGSMFSVIKRFIYDTLHVGGGLKNIEHGDYKILVEDGPNFFIAVIGKGEDISAFRRKMKEMVNEINNEYGTIISEWKGDIAEFKGVEKDFRAILM